MRELLAELLAQHGSTALRVGSTVAHAAVGLSTTDVAVLAATIGAAGSVIGGVVGGWFTLRAGHRQWQRDRSDSQAERSHQAALALAEAVAGLDEAVVTWEARPADADALRRAFNLFSRTAAVQSIALSDDTLRRRVRTHLELVGRFAALAGTIPQATALIPAVRRHTDALIEALDAHVNRKALPLYQAPPLNDVAGLLRWQPDFRSANEAE